MKFGFGMKECWEVHSMEEKQQTWDERKNTEILRACPDVSLPILKVECVVSFDFGFGIFISSLHVCSCMQQQDDRVRRPLGATQQPSKQQWSQRGMWYGSPCQHKVHKATSMFNFFCITCHRSQWKLSNWTKFLRCGVVWYMFNCLLWSPSSEVEFGHAECCTISGKEDAKKMLVCLRYTQITCPWFEPTKIHLDCRKRNKNNPCRPFCQRCVRKLKQENMKKQINFSSANSDRSNCTGLQPMQRISRAGAHSQHQINIDILTAGGWDTGSYGVSPSWLAQSHVTGSQTQP